MRDPFYRQIVAALEAKLFDPEVFESCMCDLLRDAFPSLVPIPGGSDAGMDGAIADGEGEAYPLVCTSAKDVIGNLTRSLEAYCTHGGQRRRVVLATSLSLTPRLRRNLEKRATEMGFTLNQIFEQRAIADRLYYSERWCRELLGLAWRPQALSPMPRPGRPYLEIELIGRDADVEWLRTTEGDRLITGQPGSGKTFLLQSLAREDWGVFLHSDDRGEIRNALCEQLPEVVIVDDAHEDLNQIQKLRDLRQEIRQDFAIVATCWEGERDAVAKALGTLPDTLIHRLELLTRDQILQIIRQTGLQASEDFLRELVTQARNKPGLAVTLAVLCLRGSWTEVLRGDALARSLKTDFGKLIGPESYDFAAVLAVGGNRGMPIAAAGESLGLGRHKARELAKGGVLFEVRERVLAVWPVALRSALLRQVFFERPVRQDYRPLLERAESFESAIEAILTAAHYGAEIPAQEIRDLVERCRSPEVWRTFTALGEDEARWTLEHYPGDPLDIAEEALQEARRAVVPLLLGLAEKEDASVAPSANRPLELLRGWMHDSSAEELRPGELIARRKLAVRLANQFVESGGARWVAVRVLRMALSIGLRSASRDPGSGRTITVRQGLLPLEQLRQIESIWKQGRKVIEEIDVETWSLVKELSWDWFYPESVALPAGVRPAVRDTLHSFARRVLTDLAPLAEGSPALATDLTRLASRLDLELHLPTDPLFDLLYPETADEPEQNAAAATALEEVARRWRAERQPEEVAQELVRYEREAARIGQHLGPRRTPDFCRFLAEAKNPAQWVEAFLDRQLATDLIRPFLEEMVVAPPAGWQELLTRCFETEPQAWEAVRLVLQLRDPPPDLLEPALAKAAAFPQLIETLCLRKEVPLSALRALLDHPDLRTALAAAVGEWIAEPRGQVTEAVRDSWQRVILQSARISNEKVIGDSTAGYWLGEILSGDPDLARDWLEILLRRDPNIASRVQRTFVNAVDALQETHRLEILERLEPGEWADWMVPHLLGRNVAVYGRLLELDRLRDYHLRPLAGQPNEEWVELAKLALAAGHAPREIAQACYLGEYSFVGSGHEYWSAWDRAFAMLEEDANDDLREVARYGRAKAQEGIQESAVIQRQHELDGF